MDIKRLKSVRSSGCINAVLLYRAAEIQLYLGKHYYFISY